MVLTRSTFRNFFLASTIHSALAVVGDGFVAVDDGVPIEAVSGVEKVAVGGGHLAAVVVEGPKSRGEGGKNRGVDPPGGDAVGGSRPSFPFGRSQAFGNNSFMITVLESQIGLTSEKVSATLPVSDCFCDTCRKHILAICWLWRGWTSICRRGRELPARWATPGLGG